MKREIVKTRLQGANTRNICEHLARMPKGFPRQVARFSHESKVVFVKGR